MRISENSQVFGIEQNPSLTSDHRRRLYKMEKNNNSDKRVHSVELMRDIRDKLSEEYLDNPQKEEQELSKIRKKFKSKKSTFK